VDESGRRCSERDRLEYHHRHPFGVGGDHSPNNISLMCRAHNTDAAEHDYGRQTMARWASARSLPPRQRWTHHLCRSRRWRPVLDRGEACAPRSCDVEPPRLATTMTGHDDERTEGQQRRLASNTCRADEPGRRAARLARDDGLRLKPAQTRTPTYIVPS
jgi:hypothetical protein